MGGHEDQAEEVVRQVILDELGVVLDGLRTRSGHQAHLVSVGVPPSDPVDGQIPGSRVQPSSRVVRNSVLPPLLDRCHERVLRELLGGVEITDEPGQPGQYPGRLHAPQCRNGCV